MYENKDPLSLRLPKCSLSWTFKINYYITFSIISAKEGDFKKIIQNIYISLTTPSVTLYDSDLSMFSQSSLLTANISSPWGQYCLLITNQNNGLSVQNTHNQWNRNHSDSCSVFTQVLTKFSSSSAINCFIIQYACDESAY